MTLSEERKIRHQIALIKHVRVSSVLIFSIEEQTDGKSKVYASVKGMRIGAIVSGERVLYIWRVV